MSSLFSKPGFHVLITGGSGVIGRYLTSLLLENGYKVSHLSRKQDQFGRVRVHRWDPEKGILDPVVLSGVDYIIHLAGANIGEKRWTRKRKEEIVKSRVDPLLLLHKVVTENKIPLKAFISASGTGYYGAFTSEKILTEDDLPGNDFLADTCRQWEEAACSFSNSGIRTVRIRTTVVLEKDSEILARFADPARFGIIPRLGGGRQYMPWIHISDLCNIYLKALQDDSMNGAYNASSPGHVTQSEFVRILARAMNKKGLFLPVPSLLLKAALGSMAGMVLEGSRVSPEKIIKAGYRSKFDNLQDALNDLLKE
ncbi:MAG: TIGR01777 family oxidoreductase [Bacteroidota bacterium]